MGNNRVVTEWGRNPKIVPILRRIGERGVIKDYPTIASKLWSKQSESKQFWMNSFETTKYGSQVKSNNQDGKLSRINSDLVA